MNDRVTFRRIAIQEASDAIQWYAQANPEVALRFERKLEAVIEEITNHPKRFALAMKDLREAPVLGFPYAVYYRIRSSRPIIVAVYHQSRNPDGWQTR